MASKKGAPASGSRPLAPAAGRRQRAGSTVSYSVELSPESAASKSPSSPPRRGRGVSFATPSGSPVAASESPSSPQGVWSPTVGSPARVGRRRSSAFPALLAEVQQEVGEQSVRVMLRVRPFNAREQRIHEEKSDSYLRSVVEMPQGMTAGVVTFLEKVAGVDDEYHTAEQFQFDKSFWSIPLEMHPYSYDFCSQETVYEHLGGVALKNAWSGFNTCIFAYGQTGAGKTFTMMGPFSYEEGAEEIKGQPGVIPRLCENLYVSIEKKQREQDVDNPLRRIKVSFETELSAYEIYNERVRDLFFNHTPGREPGEELKVRKHPIDGPFVDKISKLQPKTWQECLKMIEEGNDKRTVGATAMNADSSRSHSVFQIRFTQIETSIPKDKFEKPVTNRRYSVINLIDLAGSERNKKSQATGGRLVEAASINLSLTTLKRVIDSLVHNSQHPKQARQVPYRDSVLTMLLSHSLGGNSKTFMVACVSPHYDNSEETLSTLRYASAARKIVNVVTANEDSQAKQNLLLKEQLQQLQEQLEREQAAPEASPEELEELQDKIRVGQDQLQQRQEELKVAEEAAQQLQREKEEEQAKRYQAAFQHSFQMVILRRQKDEATKVAAEADFVRSQAEKAQEAKKSLEQAFKDVQELQKATTVREAEVAEYERKLQAAIKQDQDAREEILKKAYGMMWVERQRRKHNARTHEQILKDTIAQAALKHKALTDKHEERKCAFEAKIQYMTKEIADLQSQLHKEEIAHERARNQIEALESAHRVNLRRRDAAEEQRLQSAEEASRALNKEISATQTAQARMENLVKEEAESQIAEIEMIVAARVKRISADWRKQQACDENELTQRIEVEKRRHADVIAEQQTHAGDAAREHSDRLRECVAECEGLVAELGEAARRSNRYRDLARIASVGLEKIERLREKGAIEPDVEDFSHTLEAFLKLASAQPSRPSIERARLSFKACRTTTLPMVAVGDGCIVPALQDPASPQRHRGWSPSAQRSATAASSSASRRRNRSPAARSVSPSPLATRAALTMPRPVPPPRLK